MVTRARGRWLCRLVVFSLLVHLFPTQIAFGATQPVIGEVNWAGSSLSTADEWLELWNLTDQPFPLDGYKLLGAGGASGIPFSSADAIPPFGSFLIANYRADDAKSALNIAPNVVTTTVSLSNDHLSIQLVDPSGVVVDEAGTGNAPLAGSSAPKISMIRRVPIQNGKDTDSWMSATQSIGFDSGMADLGTPGSCDDCSPVPALPPDDASTVTSTSQTITPVPLEETTTSTSIDVPSSTEPAITPINIETTTTQTEITPDMTTSTPPEIQTPIEEAEPQFDASSSSDPNDDIPTSDVATTSLAILPATTPDPQEPADTTTTLLVDSSSSSSSNALEDTIERDPPQLNEVFPNPSDGIEWVELSLNGNTTEDLLDWTIEDAVGPIFHFTSSTINALASSTLFLQIPLHGSHLNNSGDSVFLRNNTGNISDQTNFPALNKNQSWIRTPDTIGDWEISHLATPGQPNIFVPELVTPPVEPITPPIEVKPKAVFQPKIKIQSSPVLPKTVALSSSSASSTKESKPTKSVATVSPKQEVKKTSPQKPKPSATRPPKTESFSQASISMLSTFESDTRVLLNGTVASIPGLLGRNQFVIQTPDGRGLLVQGNGKQPSPSFGTTIRVTGTLNFNDDGAVLRMLARDRWRRLEARANVMPRTVELLAPATEDAWSLTEVTGTVREVDKTKVTLDLDDLAVSIVIRPVIKYRAARLAKGDIVSVRGLLDIRADDPKIYPRTNTEITLVKHAEPKHTTATATTSNIPPWTPFGSAGVTVGIVQGIKQLRKFRERKRLSKLLADATQNLT